MKSWIKSALGGLSVVLLLVSMITLNDFEYFPGPLKTISIVFWACLLVYALIVGRNTLADRRTQAQERKIQRIRQTLINPELAEDTNSDTVLYLRPFKIDAQYMSEVEYDGQWYNSFESLVCRMVAEAGRPMAIGKPGEELQPLGAQRIYVSDDAWKAKVIDLFERSKYVILYADFTDGVKWEIENALANYQDKLILIPKVYNRFEPRWRSFMHFDPLYLLDLFHLLWSGCFLFRKTHRGRKYYKIWNELLGKHMGRIKMNDRISALIFENGNAIPFYCKKPNQEEQFLAIHRAINEKLGLKTEAELFLEKGEQPLFSLRADLGLRGAKNACFYPFSNGQIEFYEKGLRYVPIWNLFRINRDIRQHFNTFRHYKKSQLIPYTEIRDVLPVNGYCLMLVMKKANGSMHLSVPPYHKDCIQPILGLLEQCSADERFPTSACDAMNHYTRRHMQDYAKALLSMEALGLVLGIVLWLLAMGGSYLAAFTLFGFGAIWNLSMLLIGLFYIRFNKAKVVRILWFIAALLHILLFFWYQL